MANMIALDPRMIGFDPKENSFNRKKIGYYILGKTIAEGAFSKVKVATHVLSEQKAAIKIINRKQVEVDDVPNLYMEMKVLKLISHPHVTQLRDLICTPTYFFIAMEYAAGGDLHTYIEENEEIPRAKTRKFFQQMISGLDYCHSHLIVHRDLKPENLLLDAAKEHLKIADFGFSNMLMDGELLMTSCGTRLYTSPENYFQKAYAGPEADIWSSGAVLFTLLYRYTPFQNIFSAVDQSVDETRLRTGTFILPRDEDKDLAILLRHMMRASPAKRATMADIRDNNWFKTDLPGDLFPSPYIKYEDSFVKPAIIRRISKDFKVEEAVVNAAVLGKNPDFWIYSAYTMMLDGMIKFEKDGNEYERRHLASIPPRAFSLVATPLKQRPEQVPEYVPYPDIDPFQNSPCEEDDKLVLGQSIKANPIDVMQNLYLVLKTLRYEWITIDDWFIKIRRKNPVTSRYTMLNLRLYRRGLETCTLDFTSATKNSGIQNISHLVADLMDTDNSQEGAGQEGAGQEGAGQEGAGQEGAGQEGAGQEGAGQEGAGQEGAGQEGAGQEGAGQEGAGQEGAGQEGAGQEGAGQEGAGQEGAGQEGAGQEGAGQEGAGQEGAGQEGAGQEGAGQEGAGQEGAGQEGAGQEGAGQEGAGQEGAGQEGAGQEKVGQPHEILEFFEMCDTICRIIMKNEKTK